MGNFEAKHSPFYSLSNDSQTKIFSNGKVLYLNKDDLKEDASFYSNEIPRSSFWIVKRLKNFNNEQKNATLFDFNQNVMASESNNLYSPKNKEKLAKHLSMATNQIKMLKKLRHPNIVKYFYAEECQINNLLNGRCYLITESIRPLGNLISELGQEQIICGIFGLTSAICFLHNRASISHNNINENCIYLNLKRAWKLSDFELALGFNELNKHNLNRIYEFKCKNSITPEEEAEFEESKSPVATKKQQTFDIEAAYKAAPHSIDAYGWAFTISNILSKQVDLSNKNLNNNLKKNLKLSLSSTSTRSSLSHQNGNGNDNCLGDNDENDDDDDDDDLLDQLEAFLNKDPLKRPKLETALNLKLFDLYRNAFIDHAQSDSSNNQVSGPTNKFDYYLNKISNDNDLNLFDLNKINNLQKLDESWPKLVKYLNRYMTTTTTTTNGDSNGAHSNNLPVNETLIEFLLSPIMFFSPNACKQILPCVLIPKKQNENNNSKSYSTTTTNSNANNLNDKMPIHIDLSSTKKEATSESSKTYLFNSFIDVDIYKALVLPRVLNLFTMHSLQIRLVLLKYFPIYVNYINDKETLQYEILPELLLGLKDTNDELVSLTFNCLSFMVKLLGSEIVINNSSSSKHPRNKYFSDNMPKLISTVVSVDESSKKLASEATTDTSRQSVSSTSNNNNNYLNKDDRLNSKTSLDNEIFIDGSSKYNKLFSDSMIALHGDNETGDQDSRSYSISFTEKFNTNNTSIVSTANSRQQQMNHSSNHIINGAQSDDKLIKQTEKIDFKLDDIEDDWSNDFGWEKNDDEENESSSIKLSDSNLNLNKYKSESSNLNSNNNYFIMNGSISDDKSKSLSSSVSHQQQHASSAKKPINAATMNGSLSNVITSDFDIKNIEIKKKVESTSPSDDLINDFLNQMQPVIKPTKPLMPSSVEAKENGKKEEVEGEDSKPSLNKFLVATTETVMQKSDTVSSTWDCDDNDIDFDNI